MKNTNATVKHFVTKKVYVCQIQCTCRINVELDCKNDRHHHGHYRVSNR